MKSTSAIDSVIMENTVRSQVKTCIPIINKRKVCMPWYALFSDILNALYNTLRPGQQLIFTDIWKSNAGGKLLFLCPIAWNNSYGSLHQTIAIAS